VRKEFGTLYQLDGVPEIWVTVVAGHIVAAEDWRALRAPGTSINDILIWRTGE
jgi:hypothetical protein